MAPAAVTAKQVFEIWTRMNKKGPRVRLGKVKFRGQNIRIIKGKMKFDKGSEQNYTDKIFKLIKRFP